MEKKTEFEKTMEYFNEVMKQMPKDQLLADQKFNEMEKALDSAKTLKEKEKILNDFKKQVEAQREINRLNK